MTFTALALALTVIQSQSSANTTDLPCWLPKMITEKEYSAAANPASERSDPTLAAALVWKTKPHNGPGFSTYYLNLEVMGRREAIPDMWIFKLLTIPCDPKWEGLVAKIEFYTEDRRPLPAETMYEQFSHLTPQRNPLTLCLGKQPLDRDKYWFKITLAHNGKTASSQILDMRPERGGLFRGVRP